MIPINFLQCFGWWHNLYLQGLGGKSHQSESRSSLWCEDGQDRNALEAPQWVWLWWCVWNHREPTNWCSTELHTNPWKLHSAASNGQTKIVEILISKGADVNLKNDGGRTALHYVGLLLMEQLFVGFHFYLDLRELTPHLLDTLNACKRGDSCKYGFQGTVLQSKRI